MKVKIVRIDKTLPLPEYKTSGAVAFDVYTREAAELSPGEIRMLPSNLIIEVPEGYFLLLAERSSTFKNGIHLANSVGILDQDFHGPGDEMRIVVQNYTSETVKLEVGQRIAQALIIPIAKAEWEEVDVIKEETRGSFGSTGNF